MTNNTINTKTAALLELTAPYDNPFQGKAPRILFVCSVGLLRSPTAAAYFSERGYNTRACGSMVGCALIPISANLVEWAHQICFMTHENKQETLALFHEDTVTQEVIRGKSVVLNITDDYEYNQPELISELGSVAHRLPLVL
jgi:predicted protein tyrosine phosphatase